MDSVDYLQFVNSNAQRSDQGVASLMQALQYRQQKEQQAQQMQRQQEQDAQAKQLHDLQVAKLQEEQQYQQGLKAAMAAPPTTSTLTQTNPQPLLSLASLGINTPDYVPPPNALPDDTAQSDIAGLQSQVDRYPGLAALSGSDKRLEEMKAASPRQTVASTGSLAGLLSPPEPPRPSLGSTPEFGAQPPQVQAPMLPGVSVSTETQSPYQAGAEYAAKNGRTEEATKYINLNEEMAKRAAQERTYGSPEKAAQMEVDADKMKKAAMTFTELKKAGGMQYAIAASKQYPDLFGKIDLSKLSDKGNINTYDLPNGQQVVWSDDNPGQIHLSAAPKEFADKTQIVEIPSPDGRTAQKYRVNVDTGEKSPLGAPYAVKSQVPNVNVRVASNGTTGSSDQVKAWSDKIASGQVVLTDIPARGGIRTQVIADLAQRYPDVDLAKVKANQKWLQDKGTMQTLALVDATKGIINDMQAIYKKLDKTEIPALNAVQDVWQKWSGNPDRAEYMSMKNYGIQEVEKMLSGSGAMSDHRIKLAFDNLKETNTPEQFERAIKGIENVMAEREKATRKGPYDVAPQKAPAPKSQQSFNSMPNPVQYSGKTLTDSKTGRKYKSDGKTWRPV